MHQPIKDHLEAYLFDSRDSQIPREFHAHLAECPPCAGQLRVLSGHSQVLQRFRAVDQVEPRAGFYARVLNRIEEQKPDSFWSVFLGPVLGSRLAYACAALVLLMGTYLVSSEPRDRMQSQDAAMIQLAPDTDGTVQPETRDAVLVSLASFRE